ncbi:hypothetical protein GCM10009737_29210 [Nocardioides lentus]|uniref:N-acetyltransferase domain-containing protein n=1 Tax=Nocardioides lentus TaxID=338077 RepID=A0ABP5AYE0_9ACTN
MPHHDAPTTWRHTRTARLLLDAHGPGDLPAVHALHADPAVWGHFPSGRHTTLEQTVATVAGDEERWAGDGLAPWSVRLAEAGPGSPVVGRAGCSVRRTDEGPLPWWNLYYRLSPAVQGRGLATEVGRHAMTAAAAVAPDRPVLAFLVEHNVASRRTAEGLGLRLVHRGPDTGNPDPDAVRLVYLDRVPTAEVTAALRRLWV